MPNCHHCGDNVAPTRGKCTVCNTGGVDFCAVCAWWEVGPPEVDMESGLEAFEALNRDPEPLVHCNTPPWTPYDHCRLMNAQRPALSLRAYEKETYRFFTTLTWGAAADVVLAGVDHYIASGAPRTRMRAMMMAYLSSFESCLTDQLQRLALDDATAYLSLNDVPAFAAAHYNAHGGFGVAENLALETRTLRHIDTIEQCMKGNMRPTVAAWLILDSVNGNVAQAKQVAIEATILHLILLGVMVTWDAQHVQKAGFSADQNGASGVYTAAYVQKCLDDRNGPVASSAANNLLALLLTCIGAMPDFAGRPFRFNSVATEQAIDLLDRLTPAQKLYLKSLPDLDAEDCPAECRQVIYATTKSLLETFMGKIAEDDARQELTALLAKLPVIDQILKVVMDPQYAGPLLDHLMRARTTGIFRLQTSANDVTFLANKPYVGVWDLYARTCTLGELAAPCNASPNTQFVGTKYRESDVLRAADRRKESPFEYVSWRIQKDRAAHKFLPLSPREYEVTAAISQAYPLPEPQATYGPQMIVWKPSVLSLCTFKVRDSGRPTRGLLLMMHELLVAGKLDAQSRNSVFTLLIQLASGGRNVLQDYATWSEKNICRFPPSAVWGMVDLEVHIYGRLTLADAEAILVGVTRETYKNVERSIAVFGKDPRLVRYDSAWLQRVTDAPQRMELHVALARLQQL